MTELILGPEGQARRQEEKATRDRKLMQDFEIAATIHFDRLCVRIYQMTATPEQLRVASGPPKEVKQAIAGALGEYQQLMYQLNVEFRAKLEPEPEQAKSNLITL